MASEYCLAFVTYEEAAEVFRSNARAERILALVLQLVT